MLKYEDIKLSPSDALDLYLERYPRAIVKEIELEKKSNSYVYELEGHDDEMEYEIYVDAIEGNIIETKEKLLKGNYKDIARESTDKIGEIIDKALREAGENSELYKWSLEIEDGMLELEVKVKLEDGRTIDYKYDLGRDELIESN